MHGPVGYLVSTVILAWFTFFAVAPPRPRRSSLSNRSYWFGFLLNELPFVAFCWLLASTVLALTEDATRTWVGRGALGLAAVTVVGLAVVAWRGLQARAAVDAALEETFGAGWRDRIDPDLSKHLRRRLPLLRILLMPFARKRREVERLPNIRYGDAGPWNLLDVYRHRSRPAGSPTLVYLHGGAFRSGRKNNEARALLYRLANQGWLCISANYRLSPAARFPDHLVDVKKVIAWVRTAGVDFGADPATVIIAGSSAGGNLAVSAALTPGEPAFQPGFEHVDTSVTAAISLYGYYGHYSGGSPAGLSSPASYVHTDAPPFFLAHGDRDTFVLPEDARAFADLLRSTSSNPVVYAELPGGQHTFDLFESPRFASVVDGIEAFAALIRSRKTRAAMLPDLGSNGAAARWPSIFSS